MDLDDADELASLPDIESLIGGSQAPAPTLASPLSPQPIRVHHDAAAPQAASSSPGIVVEPCDWRPQQGLHSIHGARSASLAPLRDTSAIVNLDSPTSVPLSASLLESRHKSSGDAIEQKTRQGSSSSEASQPQQKESGTAAVDESVSGNSDRAMTVAAPLPGPTTTRSSRKAERERAREEARAFAAANRCRTSKAECATELTVRIDTSIDPALAEQIAQLCGRDCAAVERVASPVPGSVTWTRRHESIYDAALGTFVPCAAFDAPEPFVLLIEMATAFAERVAHSVSEFADTIASAYPNATVFLVVQGIPQMMRARRADLHRQFSHAVRHGAPDPAQLERLRDLARAGDSGEAALQDALLDLQIRHSFHTITTATEAATAAAVLEYTGQVALQKYRAVRANELAEQLDRYAGHVRTGAGARDTYEKMLGQIGSITPQIAAGIACAFPTLRELVLALRGPQGPHALVGVPIGTTYARRTIGIGLARKVHRALTCRDPDARMD